jgi:hypothetical protein
MGDEQEMKDPFKECRTTTKYTFAFFPHKCHSSGKRIWLRRAYRQTAIEHWSDGPDYHHRWFTPVEYTLGRLRGEIQ